MDFYAFYDETNTPEIGPILCKLAETFPPVFFTVMIHLTVYLPQEVRVGEYVH